MSEERMTQELERQAEAPGQQSQRRLRRRAEEIISRLTLTEKIGMIHGAQLFETAGVERLGIPPLRFSDGPMGVRKDFEPDKWVDVGLSDDYVTYLPCNSAIAATWDRELAFRVGSVLGEETRGRGKDVILAPGINIKRSPLCGRNFEYFSEDPYLTGELAASLVRGIQSWDVAACVKHFAVNNQETERLWVNVEVDEGALREIYLPAFYETLVKAGAYTVMGAYNLLYGEHCCQSKFLLGDILRREWGYDGLVVSDWGGVHDTVLAAEADLDVEMSVTCDFDEYFLADPLKRAVEEGRVAESRIDEKVIHILMLMRRLHMLDGEERNAGAYNTPEHRQTALEAARESVVLLKNSAGKLPLDPKKCGRMLVIGDNAESFHSNGGGSAEIKALYEISPLMGIKKLLGGNVRVDFERGYFREDEKEEGEVNWQERSLEGKSEQESGAQAETTPPLAAQPPARRTSLCRQAISRAADPIYDQVIFIGGLNHNQDCEGHDRPDMKLPYGQDELIEGLLCVRPDLVIVLTGGSPVEMGRWIKRADSLIWGWYGGMEGGTALAEVIFGRVGPSGKLPESFYKTLTDCSAHCVGDFGGKKQVNCREGRLVGYRYLDAAGIEPQFPFGHGLSYTAFSYESARVEERDGRWYAVCRIKNTGERPGAEVVQIYRRSGAEPAQAIFQALCGFERITLSPNEAREISIPLNAYPPGTPLAAGSSSRDIRLLF